MSLSASQKVYIVVLALALAAFGVDRVFLQSGPSTPALATASPEAASSAARANLAPSPAPAPPTAQESISEKLRKVSSRTSFDAAGVREAFVAPPTWPELVKTHVEAEPPKPDKAEVFVRNHQLTSVAVVNGGGSAIIDGVVVQLGETVDGFRLVAVEAEHVVLRAGSQEVRLQMPGSQ